MKELLLKLLVITSSILAAGLTYHFIPYLEKGINQLLAPYRSIATKDVHAPPQLAEIALPVINKVALRRFEWI